MAIQNNPGSTITPVQGVALPLLGATAFLDHTWNDRFTTSIGYSMIDIDNSDAQVPSAFKRGDYALANLLFTPAQGVTTGVEVQWGRRENFADGFSTDILKVQFSFKYNFSRTFRGPEVASSP